MIASMRMITLLESSRCSNALWLFKAIGTTYKFKFCLPVPGLPCATGHKGHTMPLCFRLQRAAEVALRQLLRGSSKAGTAKQESKGPLILSEHLNLAHYSKCRIA